MAIVSIKWAGLKDPNKQPSFQDATGAAPVVPVPTFDSATTTSYTAAITGYDAQFTYTVSASVGTATRTGGNVTVSGLSGNQSSTLTVTAANTARELSFSSSQAFLSLPATPTLTQTGQTTSSVTVTIGNYDAGLTYTIGSTVGSATRSGNAINVTGLTEGQTVTVTATASNASGNSAQGSVSATSEILGDFESIATVTLATQATDIDFTSIPTDYQHLQIRLVARSTFNGTHFGQLLLTFNSLFGTPWAYQWIYGTSSGRTASAVANQSSARVGVFVPLGANAANIYGAAVINILNYASTSSAKTVRSTFGADLNSYGYVGTSSALYNNPTGAVDSIKLRLLSNYNFTAGTTVALYGVKAP